MTVEQYLISKHLNFSTARRPSGLEFIMDCPFCDDTKKKFAINAETGRYKCMRQNHCGVSGHFNSFREHYGDSPVSLDGEVKFVSTKKDYKKPNQERFEETKVTTPVLDWLHSRKISDKTISKFKITEGQLGWVAFPYYKDGKLLNVKQRKIDDKAFRNTPGKEPSLYNRDNIKPNGNEEWELTIVEGEMDCLAMDTYGIPSVSLPDGVNSESWIDLEWQWLEKFTRINICLDMDKAGDKGKVSLNQRLGEDRCFDVKLPLKDANECLMAGISADEIIRCIDNAKHFPIEGVKEATDFLGEILHGIEHPEDAIGIETPFQYLTKTIKGFRMGELTIIAGSNHSGKTTYVGQMISYLARHNYISCIASLEMKPAKTLEWMIRQNSYKGELTRESSTRFMKEVAAGRIYLIDAVKSVTPDFLFKAWELSAKRHGTKFFVLDSLSLINLKGKNKNEAQSEFMARMMAFVHEWKCHVFMIAHVRKAEKDNYTSGKVDISGSGDITNLAHNVIMVKRLEESEPEDIKKSIKAEKGLEMDAPETIITIKKCREIGITGKHFLKFNPESKLFSDILYY